MRLSGNRLLISNKLPCSGSMQPKASGDQTQQCDTKQVSTLAFQTRFAEEFFETSIGNQGSAAGYQKHVVTCHFPNDCIALQQDTAMIS